MHWTTHILAGAAWGYTIGSPPPAFFSGLFGHIALDAMPHKDPEEDWGYVLDSALGAGILVLLFRKSTEDFAWRSAFWGAAGGALPDLELLRNVVRKTAQHERMFPSHDGTIPHRESDLYTSMKYEILFVGTGIVAALVMRRRRQARRRT